VAALAPLLSVPAAGGPVVPVFTTKLLETFPEASAETMAVTGFVQLTGMLLPSTAIVGWPVAVEHWITPPRLAGVNPDPVTVTVCPSVRFVLGVTLRAGAASAGLAVTTMNAQKMSTPTASVRRLLRRSSRRPSPRGALSRRTRSDRIRPPGM
jgi:hypothetical protein